VALERLCPLLSGEARQELAERLYAGPSGACSRQIVAASQSNRQWLVVAINFPAPSPRMGVRLLHDDMIFGDRVHATIVRQSPLHARPGHYGALAIGVSVPSGSWRTMAWIVHGSAVGHRGLTTDEGGASPMAVAQSIIEEPKAAVRGRFRRFRWAGRQCLTGWYQ
jgi:hypothetical protein